MTFQYTEQFPPAAEIHVTRLHLTGEHEPSFFIQCLSKERFRFTESARTTYQYVTGKTNAEDEGEQQEGRSE